MGGLSSTVFLENVKYVPGVGVNLFSVNKATAAGAETSFVGDTCRIKKNGETKLVARLIHGLWVIQEGARTFPFLRSTLRPRRFGTEGFATRAMRAWQSWRKET